jgi:hypothetical protein
MPGRDNLLRLVRRWSKLQVPAEYQKVLTNQILEDCLKRRWLSALGLASSFWRFDLFIIMLAPEITPSELRDALADIWPKCDGCIWPWRDLALHYLRETGYIGDLPHPKESLVLYRGVSKARHRLGVSWSLDADRARSFVRPFGRGPNVRGGFLYRAEAPPDSILAGFAKREEAEYVADPAKLRKIRLVKKVNPD